MADREGKEGRKRERGRESKGGRGKEKVREVGRVWGCERRGEREREREREKHTTWINTKLTYLNTESTFVRGKQHNTHTHTYTCTHYIPVQSILNVYVTTTYMYNRVSKTHCTYPHVPTCTCTCTCMYVCRVHACNCVVGSYCSYEQWVITFMYHTRQHYNQLELS